MIVIVTRLMKKFEALKTLPILPCVRHVSKIQEPQLDCSIYIIVWFGQIYEDDIYVLTTA